MLESAGASANGRSTAARFRPRGRSRSSSLERALGTTTNPPPPGGLIRRPLETAPTSDRGRTPHNGLILTPYPTS